MDFFICEEVESIENSRKSIDFPGRIADNEKNIR